jgi:hypothetical protein
MSCAWLQGMDYELNGTVQYTNTSESHDVVILQ